MYGKEQDVAVINGPHESSNYRANAHLIAAAPEMLEALENIIAAHEASTYGDSDANLDLLFDGGFLIARAAIAKAKGETR